jgi:hypothetical protein
VRREAPADFGQIHTLVTATMRPNEAELVALTRAWQHYVAGG